MVDFKRPTNDSVVAMSLPPFVRPYNISQLRPRELHVSLTSNKCCVPRYTTLAIDQRSNELAVRRPIDCGAFRGSVGLPLIDVEEPVTVISAD
jgi:hypothetical protein